MPKTEGKKPWLIAFALSLVWTLSFIAFKPTPLEGIDYVRFYGPYLHYLRESLLSGSIPWWNPYSSLGRPFAIDMQAALLYPATALIVLVGPFWGWVIGTLAHGMLAAFGTRRLCARAGAGAAACWAAACVYLFSGQLYGRMQEGEVNYVYALCYMPWVLDACARFCDAPSARRWGVLAGLLALQLACGHPQIFWMSSLGSALWIVGTQAGVSAAHLRRLVLRGLGLLGASVAAMAALGIVLIPFLQLASQSNRASASLAFSGAFSLAPLQWLSLVWPTLGGYGVNWEYNGFIGTAVLAGGLGALLRLRDPGMRGYLAVACGAALVAAGPATPVFVALFHVLPGLSSFRVPARCVSLVALALIVGAARLTRDPGEGPATRRPLGLWLASLASAVFSVVYLVRLQGPWSHHPVMLANAVLALAGLAAWTGLQGRRPFASWLLAFSVACGLVLSVAGIKQAYRFDSEFPEEAPLAKALGAGADPSGPPRVCLDSDVFRENAGMEHHWSSVVGYESLSLARVWDYVHRASGADPAHAYSTIPDGRIFNVAPKLGVFALKASLSQGSSRLVIEHAPDPRAYLVTRTTRVHDYGEAIALMLSGADPHQSALIEDAFSAAIATDPGRDAGGARITRFEPERIEVTVDSPGASLLVLSEAWYPGWRATVEGKRAACIPANAWMRAVAVPAGRSQVVLVYHQEGLAAGALASLAGLGAIVGSIAWRGLSRREAGPARP